MADNATQGGQNKGGFARGFLKIFCKLRWIWLALFLLTLGNTVGYFLERSQLVETFGNPPSKDSMKPVKGILLNYETAKKVEEAGGVLDENTVVPIRDPEAERKKAEEAKIIADAKAMAEMDKSPEKPTGPRKKKKKAPEPEIKIEYSGIHLFDADNKKVYNFYCDYPSVKAVDTFTGETARGKPTSNILNTCDWVYRELAWQNLCDNCGNVTKLYGNVVSVRADANNFVYEVTIDGKPNISYENITKLYRQHIDKFGTLATRFLLLSIVLLVFTLYGFMFAKKFHYSVGNEEGAKASPAPAEKGKSGDSKQEGKVESKSEAKAEAKEESTDDSKENPAKEDDAEKSKQESKDEGSN